MYAKLPKQVLEIINKLEKAGFQAYIVGGAVRDLLMERGVSDWDFTTDAKPEEVLKLFPNGFYDNKFGTVGVPIQIENKGEGVVANQEVFEITTMRKEAAYKDHRHPIDVSWTNKIEEDLARRDFTVNAIALKIPNFELIDPFNGQGDIQAKLIRSVCNPDERFKEDALRLLRAIRIASELNFEIEKKTFSAIKKNVDLIKKIAFERIRDELFKLLASANAYEGILQLEESGILKIILPELQATKGIVQEGPKHDRIYEILDHSFRCMRETPSKDPLVKFAALLHDIGKAKTFKKDRNGNVTFYNHDIVGAELAIDIAKRLNLSKKQTDKLFKLIRWHMFSTNENQTDSAIRRFIKNVSLENLESMFALRIGDRLGGDTRKPVSWRMEEFQKRIKQVLIKPFSISDLKVTGHDVMEVLQIKPGRKVGEVLEKLFNEISEDAPKNNRDYLLNRMKQIE